MIDPAVYIGMNNQNKIVIGPILTEPLRRVIDDTFKLKPDGVHGWPHWNEVMRRGLDLARTNRVNPQLVIYFAYLHDVCRQNDGRDPQHGERGSLLAIRLRRDGLLPDIDDQEFDDLAFAIYHHSGGYTQSTVNVMTCWDADRLDLGRKGVDVKVSPTKLCTVSGRQYLQAMRKGKKS